MTNATIQAAADAFTNTLSVALERATRANRNKAMAYKAWRKGAYKALAQHAKALQELEG